jgi:hypothetical protein
LSKLDAVRAQLLVTLLQVKGERSRAAAAGAISALVGNLDEAAPLAPGRRQNAARVLAAGAVRPLVALAGAGGRATARSAGAAARALRRLVCTLVKITACLGSLKY